MRIQARVRTSGLTTMDVDLYDNLNVVTIATGSTSHAYTRGGNRLHVALNRAYAAGEIIDITVTYGGTPLTVGLSGSAFTFKKHPLEGGIDPIISSLSEPTYAPAWWPCIDDPADKAIVDLNLTVPSNLVGVSNGLLVATLLNGNGTTTYQWRSSYPISTYLVSVAISNYVSFGDVYYPVSGGPPMPIQHWVYPESNIPAKAATDFSATASMIAFFAETFGEYPFVNEKYGHALFPFGGAMEHQTATSYGDGLIFGDRRYDWVVAHELSHQWWGNSVGPADWREIWLNEGFASYCEALWMEHLGGTAALQQYVTGSFLPPPFCGTVYDPPSSCPGGLFGATVYDKGGWVLHMLRRVIGDAAFFRGLRDYASTFQYGSATTRDFQEIMEAASGRSLGPFFDRWVFETGEPGYRWGWTAATTPGGWVTHVRVEQLQEGNPFTMPIDLRVTTSAGVFDFTVQNTAAAQDFALPALQAAPTGVAFDPDAWILKTALVVTLADGDADGVPDTADDCALIFNPGQENLDGDGLGDACDPDTDGDGRENGSDCAPLDARVQDAPAEIGGVTAGSAAALDLAWSVPAVGPAGITYDVLRGSLLDLRATASTGSATCLATGLTAPMASDLAARPAGDGFYYLVRARNVCGAGTIGVSFSGQPRLSTGCP